MSSAQSRKPRRTKRKAVLLFVSPDLLARIDAYVARLRDQRPGAVVSRVGACRELLWSATAPQTSTGERAA